MTDDHSLRAPPPPEPDPATCPTCGRFTAAYDPAAKAWTCWACRAGAVKAACHPVRRAFRDTLCRECFQVASPPADHPLPAQIFRAEQRAGLVIPPRCSKCGSVWDSDGDFARCPLCGATYHRTSRKVILPPRTTQAYAERMRAISGRADRRR